MSQHVFWEPSRRKKERVGDIVLKNALLRRECRLLSDRDYPYLNGLADADVAGAKELIEAIERNGEISITIE